MPVPVPKTTPRTKLGLVFRGFLPPSFSDYRGRIAAVLFTGGCNFRCRFCYNRDLVLRPETQPPLGADEVLERLAPRRGFLDAVVISGGEPTLEPGLLPFLAELKALGFLVGLDTNGSRPEVLRTVIERRLADRLAMDYKAPLDKYEAVTGAAGMEERVAESVGLVAHAGMDYEIRVTLHPALHSHEDIAVMAAELAECGVRSVALQTFKPWNVLDPRLNAAPGYGAAELRAFAALFPGSAAVR